MCHQLQNYSAVVSILSGLESAPIYRLARTWAMVTERSCNMLRPLQAMILSAQNFHAYRETLRAAVPPCIPFLGKFGTSNCCRVWVTDHSLNRSLFERPYVHRGWKPSFNGRGSDKLPQVYAASDHCSWIAAMEGSSILLTTRS
jgi:hypothetical protein